MLGLDHFRGHGEAICARGLDRHRFDAEGFQNVAIRRIARRCDRHARARIEKREERQREAARRTGRDDDPLGRHLDAIAIAVMPRDPRAQARAAERLGIADPAAIERGNGGFPHDARRRRGGLADFEMNNVLPVALPAGGGGKHVQGHERRDIGSEGQRNPRQRQVRHKRVFCHDPGLSGRLAPNYRRLVKLTKIANWRPTRPAGWFGPGSFYFTGGALRCRT